MKRRQDLTILSHSPVGFVGNNLTSLGRKSEAFMAAHNKINNLSRSFKELMTDLQHIQMSFC